MKKTHTSKLREWAKVFSGLIIADMLFGIWAASGQGYGSIFLGITLKQPLINVWLVIDAALLLLLVHYAWHVKLPVSPVRKIVYIAIGCLLSLVAIGHFLRLLFSVPLIIGGLAVPFWLSIIGAIIPGFLAYTSFHFARVRN